MFIQSYNFLNRTGCKKRLQMEKGGCDKIPGRQMERKSSCLAAPCVASNLHWRLCLVLALALSDSFTCCTMYHTYLVSNSLVFLSFGNGFYFFFRHKHVQVLHFFPKCLLSFRSFSFIYFFISAISQIDFSKRNSIFISKMLSRSQTTFLHLRCSFASHCVRFQFS